MLTPTQSYVLAQRRLFTTLLESYYDQILFILSPFISNSQAVISVACIPWAALKDIRLTVYTLLTPMDNYSA